QPAPAPGRSPQGPRPALLWLHHRHRRWLPRLLLRRPLTIDLPSLEGISQLAKEEPLHLARFLAPQSGRFAPHPAPGCRSRSWRREAPRPGQRARRVGRAGPVAIGGGEPVLLTRPPRPEPPASGPGKPATVSVSKA